MLNLIECGGLETFFLQHHISPRLRCSKRKITKKVLARCLTFHLFWTLVSIFSFLLLPTGSTLMKLGQVWPLWPPPDHTKCFLTLKSSPQPFIYIFRKSKKIGNFSHSFFSGNHKSVIGGDQHLCHKRPHINDCQMQTHSPPSKKKPRMTSKIAEVLKTKGYFKTHV